jgi:hypothetical protein
MEKSLSIAALAKSLACFQGKMGKVKKDANNPFFKSKYASLGNILEAIQEPLSDCGLCFSQFPSDNHGLTTILIHAESGEFLQSTYFMKPTKDDPQGVGSTITYQRRYSLAAVLGLNIDEDDDGNAGSQPSAAAQQKPAAREEDARPWLTEKQFNQAMERITNGEVGVFAKIDKAFKMKKEYKQQLTEAEKGVLV